MNRTHAHTDIKAVLFDLDGTLLDTAPDLASALNQLLDAHQRPKLPYELIRSKAGLGAELLAMAFNVEKNDPQWTELREQWFNLYEKTVMNQTQLFVGMETVLTYLDQNTIPWGIVTNKQSRFTIPLVKGLQLFHRAACVISGDTLANNKPHPEPLVHASHMMQCPPAHCLYVGDAETDIIASRAAGMKSIIALYGYIPDTAQPTHWGADGTIETPIDLIHWLKNTLI